MASGRMQPTYHLTVIRHGETNENRLGIIQGQMDCALSDKGLQQARALGCRLAEEKTEFTHVFSSDLQRALQTAVLSLDKVAKSQSAPVDCNADSVDATRQTSTGSETTRCSDGRSSDSTDIIKDPLLREYCFGRAQGMTRRELSRLARENGFHPHDYVPDGAESEHQLQDRVRTFLGKLHAFLRGLEDDAAETEATRFSSSAALASSTTYSAALQGQGQGESPRSAAPKVQGDSPRPIPNIAVYSHGGWIRVFYSVVMMEYQFANSAGCKRDQLMRSTPNTSVSRFSVRIGDGVTTTSRVECTMAHDIRHLDKDLQPES